MILKYQKEKYGDVLPSNYKSGDPEYVKYV